MQVSEVVERLRDRSGENEYRADLIRQLENYEPSRKIILRGRFSGLSRPKTPLFVEECYTKRSGEHLRVVGPDVFIYG